MKQRSELDHHLLEFAGLLREGGVPVSMTEVQDALQALLVLGIEDKERTEGILQATLVKSPQSIPWFQETFRVFFAPPERQMDWQKEAREKADQFHQGLNQSRRELSFKGRELDLTDEQLMAYMQLPEKEQERLKDFLNRSEQGIHNGLPVDHSFQPMIERVMRGSLEYWRKKLGEENDFPLSPPGKGGIMSEIERAWREQEIKYVTKDLKNISPEEWPQVMKLIHKLSQRLAFQASRRYQVRGRRGGVDMRHTLRDNLRFGGVLLKRHFRIKRRSRPKFVLLCDLSGSMMKYTEFMLQFIYGLSSVVSGIETFAFADRLVKLTGKVRPGRTLQEMLELALPEVSKEWGGGTNLAIALEELAENHARCFSRGTVLIILSDTQTLEGGKAAHLLKNFRGKVREILWLNTLPQKRWEETKTVALFQPYCRMVECYTLEHLQNIMNAHF